MSTFAHHEDVRIVQYAIEFSGKRIPWSTLATAMNTGKRPEQLRLRLVTLKRRFGQNLARFPRCILSSSSAHERQHTNGSIGSVNCSPAHVPEETLVANTTARVDPNCHAPVKESLLSILAMFDNDDDSDDGIDHHTISVVNQTLDNTDAVTTYDETSDSSDSISDAVSQASNVIRTRLQRRPKQAPPPDTSNMSDVHEIIYKLFQDISASQIRQESGKKEHNAGELTPLGTSQLIDACKMSSNDVFVDVGSGIGNVVAQVAIEAGVAASIGIEVRKDVAALGKSHMDANIDSIPALKNVTIFTADIQDMDFETAAWSAKVSVLYCHNTLFTQQSQFAVERMCCNLPRLDIVVLQQPFCFRHRETCTKDFCAIFKKDPAPLRVPVSYTGKVTTFHVYRRQIICI